MTIGPNWSGMLTTQNADAVAQQLIALLGGKRHTVEAWKEGYWKQDIYTHQWLIGSDPIKVVRHSGGSVSIYINNDYGLWEAATSLEQDVFDPDFKNPYFKFEGDRVTITLRAPIGRLLKWTFIPEDR